MPELAELTAEEAQEFTVFNAIAFDLHREESKAANKIPPCWLCMSAEAKAECRQNAVRWLTGAMRPIVPFTLETAEKVVQRDHAHRLAPQVELWRNMERELKQARSEGNPRAYFAG